MLLQFTSNNEKIEADLADGTVTVGGDPADGVCIEGLEPQMVTLTVQGATVSVTSKRAVRIGAALFPAQVPRLLLAGEAMQLPNGILVSRPVDVKARESRKNLGTAFVAQGLISNDFGMLPTRAAGLTCVAGNDVGTHFSIAFTDCTLGRGDDVDIRIRDRAVSRRHARIFRDGKHSVVALLSNTNGAFLNGVKIDRAQRLNDGDLIELGQTMLRFESGERAPEERTVIGTPEPTAAPPPAPFPSPGQAPQADLLELAETGAVDLSESGGFEGEIAKALPSKDVWLMGLGAVLALVGAAISVCVLR